MPKEQKTAFQSMGEVNSELYRSNQWRPQGTAKAYETQPVKMQAVQEGKSSGQTLAETLGVVINNTQQAAPSFFAAQKADDVEVAKARANVLRFREDFRSQLRENKHFMDLPEEQRKERIKQLEDDTYTMYMDGTSPEALASVSVLHDTSLRNVYGEVDRVHQTKQKEDYLSSHVYTANDMLKQMLAVPDAHLETATLRQFTSDYYDTQIKGTNMDPGRDAWATSMIATFGDQATDAASSGDFAKADTLVKLLKEPDSAKVAWGTVTDGDGKLKFGPSIDAVEANVLKLKEAYTKKRETDMKEYRDSTYGDLLGEIYNGDSKAVQGKISTALASKALKPEDAKTLFDLHLKFQSGSMKEDSIEDFTGWAEEAMTGGMSEHELFKRVRKGEIQNKGTVKELLTMIGHYKDELKADKRAASTGDKSEYNTYAELLKGMKATFDIKYDIDGAAKANYALTTYRNLVLSKRASPSEAFATVQKSYGLTRDPNVVAQETQRAKDGTNKLIERNPMKPGFKMSEEDRAVIIEYLKTNPQK